MSTYRARRRSGPAAHVTELQRIDLATGLQSGASFASEQDFREAWELSRTDLISACQPSALPFAFWRLEAIPDDCRDTIYPGEDVLEAHERVTRARVAWAQAVHAAMAARR